MRLNDVEDEDEYDPLRWQLRQVPRHAVLVAQMNYADANQSLNSSRATRRIQSKLENLGFQGHVTTFEDAQRRLIVEAIKAIRDRLKGGGGKPEVVFFYFNGRAREEGGTIKLCTVDGDDIDVLSDLVRPLNLYGRGCVFVIVLDCCRDEEDGHLFPSEAAASQALVNAAQLVIQSAIGSPHNQFVISFACDPAKRLCGPQEGDGAFSSTLLKNIHKRISVLDMLTLVTVGLGKSAAEGLGGPGAVALASTFGASPGCKFTLSWDDLGSSGWASAGGEDRSSAGSARASRSPSGAAGAGGATAAESAAYGMAGMTLYPQEGEQVPAGRVSRGGFTTPPGRAATATTESRQYATMTLYPETHPPGSHGPGLGAGQRSAAGVRTSGAGEGHASLPASRTSPRDSQGTSQYHACTSPTGFGTGGGAATASAAARISLPGGSPGSDSAPAQLVMVCGDGVWPDAWLSEQRTKGYVLSHLAVMCVGGTSASGGRADTRSMTRHPSTTALVVTRMHVANAGRRHPGAGALVSELQLLPSFSTVAMVASDHDHYCLVSMAKVQLGPEGLHASACCSATSDFIVTQASEAGCVVISLAPDLVSSVAADGRDALATMAFRFNRPQSGPAQHIIISDPGASFPIAEVNRHMQSRGSFVRAAAYMPDVRQWLVVVDYVPAAMVLAEQRFVVTHASQSPDSGEVSALMRTGFKITALACGPRDWVTVLARPLPPTPMHIAAGGGLHQRAITMLLNPQSHSAWLSMGSYKSLAELSVIDMQASPHQIIMASVSQEWPQEQLTSLRHQGYLLTAILPVHARPSCGRSDMDLLVLTRAAGVPPSDVWSAWRFVKADAASFDDLAAETQGPRATTSVASLASYGSEGAEWVAVVHGRRCSTWESTWLVAVPLDEAADKYVSMPGQVVSMCATNGVVMLAGARGLSWGAGKVAILSADRDVVEYIKELHAEGYVVTAATYSEPDRKWLIAATVMTGPLERDGPKQAAFMAYGWEGARGTVQDFLSAGYFMTLLCVGPSTSMLAVVTDRMLLPARAR